MVSRYIDKNSDILYKENDLLHKYTILQIQNLDIIFYHT